MLDRRATTAGVTLPGSIILASVALATACEWRPVEVSRPFYLMYIKDPREVALFRCPDGPDRGCAIDGLPGPRVIAAGADARFVVVAQLPEDGASGPVRYYYFARVPQESRGWGLNPEKVVGPLDEVAFAQAKTALHLPDLTVKP
jgi:hypothetical protein